MCITIIFCAGVKRSVSPNYTLYVRQGHLFDNYWYVKKTLAKFKHPKPMQKQNQPHLHILPKYGATTQYAMDKDPTLLVGPE